MGKIKTFEAKEFQIKLATLADNAEKIAKAALYDGAGVVADAIREEIPNIPISEEWGTPHNPKRGPSADEWLAINECLGISEMKTENGKTDVSIGFGGYSSITSNRWPKGIPAALVVRSVERGTSFMYATPFVKRAAAKARATAEKAMLEAADREIKKITK